MSLVETRVANDALDHPALGATGLGQFISLVTELLGMNVWRVWRQQ